MEERDNSSHWLRKWYNCIGDDDDNVLTYVTDSLSITFSTSEPIYRKQLMTCGFKGKFTINIFTYSSDSFFQMLSS